MPMSFNSMLWFDIISECLHVMHSCSGFRHSIARCLLERLKSAQCHSSAIRRCVSYVVFVLSRQLLLLLLLFFRTQLGRTLVCASRLPVCIHDHNGRSCEWRRVAVAVDKNLQWLGRCTNNVHWPRGTDGTRRADTEVIQQWPTGAEA